jgi:hypothetical protein
MTANIRYVPIPLDIGDAPIPGCLQRSSSALLIGDIIFMMLIH